MFSINVLRPLTGYPIRPVEDFGSVDFAGSDTTFLALPS